MNRNKNVSKERIYRLAKERGNSDGGNKQKERKEQDMNVMENGKN
jgi:hypothetical protein